MTMEKSAAVWTGKESFETLTVQRWGEYDGGSNNRHVTCLDSYRISRGGGDSWKRTYCKHNRQDENYGVVSPQSARSKHENR